MAAIAAIAATAAVLAGCGSSRSSAPAPLPIAEVSRRYTAAVDPANAALADMLKKVLAYSGGPTTAIDAATAPTAATLKKAAGQLRAIGVAGFVRRDILDVADTLSRVVGDLTDLRSATGDGVQPSIARLVADAGRENAADTLVRVEITQLTIPSTAPLPTVAVPTTVALTTTTVSRRTPTTRARTTTTRPRTTTTTRPGTTATSHP